jgi:hypothetical protein
VAHRQPLGTLCSLGSCDTDAEVSEGDVIRSSGGSHYLVLSARRVTPRSRHYPYRWNLECLRIGPDEVPEDAVVHPLYWYSRDRK